jgi:hypothetical protein
MPRLIFESDGAQASQLGWPCKLQVDRSMGILPHVLMSALLAYRQAE